MTDDDHYNDDEIRHHLSIRPSLVGIRESHGEWHIGTISVDKRHPHFRSGWGRPLQAGMHLRKQWFDLDGRRGWAIIFHAGPPDPPEYFAGWVEPEREAEADEWIAFLNREIAARLAAHAANAN